jgi:hypothetical protein
VSSQWFVWEPVVELSGDVALEAADAEIPSNLRDLAAGLYQIQYAPTELRRIPTSPHAVLLQDSSIRVQLRDSTKPGAHQAVTR